MNSGDLAEVFAIQCRAHAPAYHEPLAALASRHRCGDGFCFVGERSGALCAYLLAHPWRGEAPSLHAPLVARILPDHLFLHDLAILPAQQRSGLASRLLGRFLDAARQAGFSEARLVALAGVVDFWRAQHWQPLDAPLDRSYGAGARLMGLRLV